MLLLVLLAVLAVIALIASPPRRRARVERLLHELDRSEDEAELNRAEDEVRDLEIAATPEDAAEQLPDWGPGAPRPKRSDR